MAVEGQRAQASAAAPVGKVARSRVVCTMLRGMNRGGGGLDQDLELLAGDIRIHPIAEGFLFPIEPRLLSMVGEAAGAMDTRT